MNRLSKILFFSSIILLFYGHLCRIASIYFFWDSKTIGWLILGIALLVQISHDANKKLQRGNKVIIHIIAFLILIFVVGFTIIFNIVLKTSADSYQIATEFLRKDAAVINQVGNVKGFSLFTSGSVSTARDNSGYSGFAIYELTVRGDRIFKDIKIRLSKDPMNTDWVVDSVDLAP